MKILQINVVYPNGSTGRICEGIYTECTKQNVECKIAYAYASKKFQEGIPISSYLDNHFHNRLARITMLEGCFSFFHTLFFLKKVKTFNPDVIHLHNIHGNYLNIPLLTYYINKNNIKTVLTMHDCWAFTGYCKYFTASKCNKWKTKCKECPLKGKDKANIIDNSQLMFMMKHKLFSTIDNFTLVAPSEWIYNIARESYLGGKNSVIINNGINLERFKPTPNNVKDKYNCRDKFIVLGVALGWEFRKGLDVFVELDKQLDERFQIVLVGTDDKIDTLLPNSVISIHRTNSQEELAMLYSAADVFVNPTREENFPTVNIEAIACGTPVITFDTGGSPEIIDSTCGVVVPVNDIDCLKENIERICIEKPYDIEKCLNRSKLFDRRNKFLEYINLYKTLMEKDCLHDKKTY